MGNTKGTRERFGNVTQLRSGRWQARYKRGGQALTAKTEDGLLPLTFKTKTEARRWLDGHAERIRRGEWPPTAVKPTETLAVYGEAWIASRRRRGRHLADRTQDHYRQLLRDHLLPTFGSRPLASIEPADVRRWHGELQTGPTARAHAYSLLSAILSTAVRDETIPSNPCRVENASSAETVKQMRPLETPAQLEALTEAMPERYRMLVQLAVWCSLRFGEATALQRGDVDLDKRLLHVDRAVVRTTKGVQTKAPKTKGSTRTVVIPRHLVDGLRAHLADHVETARDALLFPAAGGGPLAPSSLYRVFYPARAAIGRSDLRFHDLRHTGQTWAARNGAGLRDLMVRTGHTTPAVAMKYIHGLDEQQRRIADGLSDFAAGEPARAAGAR